MSTTPTPAATGSNVIRLQDVKIEDLAAQNPALVAGIRASVLAEDKARRDKISAAIKATDLPAQIAGL